MTVPFNPARSTWPTTGEPRPKARMEAKRIESLKMNMGGVRVRVLETIQETKRPSEDRPGSVADSIARDLLRTTRGRGGSCLGLGGGRG